MKMGMSSNPITVSPHLVGCIYYALGPEGPTRGGEYIHYYYGVEWGPMVVQSMPTTDAAIRETRQAFAGLGTDELIFWPCIADLDQIDRLEDALKFS